MSILKLPEDQDFTFVLLDTLLDEHPDVDFILMNEQQVKQFRYNLLHFANCKELIANSMVVGPHGKTLGYASTPIYTYDLEPI